MTKSSRIKELCVSVPLLRLRNLGIDQLIMRDRAMGLPSTGVGTNADCLRVTLCFGHTEIFSFENGIIPPNVCEIFVSRSLVPFSYVR